MTMFRKIMTAVSFAGFLAASTTAGAMTADGNKEKCACLDGKTLDSKCCPPDEKPAKKDLSKEEPKPAPSK